MPPVHCCNTAVRSQLSRHRLLRLKSFLPMKTVITLFSVSAFSKREESELEITGDKKGFDGIYTCVSGIHSCIMEKHSSKCL